MLKVKRVNKSNLLYGMVWFVILLLADIYNIFTRIICSIGAYEFFTIVIVTAAKYSLQGTTQGRYLTGGVPPVRFSM